LGQDDPAQQEALQRQQQIQEELARIESEHTQSETNENNATTEKIRQEATQLQIENALILRDPSAVNVSV
jgi:hypothetical protein